MKITFFGAVGQVTGSRHMVESGDTRILVDCGMFQGPPEVAQQNWDAFPVKPSSIDAVVLTHAHIDHTGYIPRLVNKGFHGTVYCTSATYELCKIMLADSAAILEQNATDKKTGELKYEPLYTVEDAMRALALFKPIDYEKNFDIGPLRIHFIRAGHILGAAFVIVSDGKKTLTFSGDLGRPHTLLMKETPYLTETDYLVLESTYGDRLHEPGDPIEALGAIVNQTMSRHGVLVIPSFSVGRTQMLLYYLYQLKEHNTIPDVPIYLDSPMGIRVTDLFCDYPDEHTLSRSECKKVFSIATPTPTVEDSKKISQQNRPMIIIVGSGMADGGRVFYHFKDRIADEKNTILFVGYQARGTDGRTLTDGSKTIDIFGKEYPVRAHIASMNMLSAHADYEEILAWLSHFKAAPRETFLTHGDPDAAISLQKKIEAKFGWKVTIPAFKDSFELD